MLVFLDYLYGDIQDMVYINHTEETFNNNIDELASPAMPNNVITDTSAFSAAPSNATPNKPK